MFDYIYKLTQKTFLLTIFRYLLNYHQHLSRELAACSGHIQKDVCTADVCTDLLPSGLQSLCDLDTRGFKLAPHHVVYSIVTFDLDRMRNSLKPKQWDLRERMSHISRKSKPQILPQQRAGVDQETGQSCGVSSDDTQDSGAVKATSDTESTGSLSEFSSAGESQDSKVMSN